MTDGTDNDCGYSIAIDAVGYIYVTGYFSGTATFGGTSLTSAGGNDIFVAKFDSSGNWKQAIRAGGTDNDYGFNIDLDAAGNIYIAGRFYGTANFGGLNLNSSTNTSIFIAKLDVYGQWEWAVEKNVKIFPNPSTGLFTVENALKQRADVRVYEATGRIVHNFMIQPEGSINLDYTHLKPAVYNEYSN